MTQPPITIFFSYDHADDEWRDRLRKQLRPWERQKLIKCWCDRQIPPGGEWNREIEQRLNSANIILLLVSPDFLDSDFCMDKEYSRAIARHNAREACVIPVILRPCLWKESIYNTLQAYPKDLLPVTSWPNPEEALRNVAEGILAAMKLQMLPKPQVPEQLKAFSDQDIESRYLNSQRYAVEEVRSEGTARQTEMIAPMLEEVSSPFLSQSLSPEGMGGADQPIHGTTSSQKKKVADPLTGKEQESRRLKAPKGKKTSADFSEVLKMTDAIYSRKTGKNLSDIQRAIVQGAWQSWTYERIASSSKTSLFRVEQSASRLWEVLSEAMREKITKTTFRATLKRKLQRNNSSRFSNVEPSVKRQPNENTQTWKNILSCAGHKGWINAIAISRDSQTLISGGQDCSVKSWNLQTGECKQTFGNVLWAKPHTKPVQAVAIDLNSNIAASASEDSTLKIWTLSTGKHRYKSLEHRGAVYSLAVSPDNQIIASGCSDQTIKIWGLADGQCHSTFSRHSGSVNSVAFSPDGRWLTSASEDKTVNVWDLSTRKLSASLPKYTSAAKFTTFSADGKYLAIIYADRTIRLLDFQTGDVRYEVSGEAVAIDYESKILASSLDKEIMIWDLLTGELTTSFKGGAGFIRCLSFAPGNYHHYTLVSSHDEIIKVWRLERAEH